MLRDVICVTGMGEEEGGAGGESECYVNCNAFCTVI